jgi:hypothetical protein
MKYRFSRQSGQTPLPFIAKVGIACIFIAMLVLLLSGGMFETNKAGYVKICQMPVSGDLKVIDTPGMFYQGFGDVTEYKQAGTYTFGKPHSDAADDLSDSITSEGVTTRFNDGGTATWSGNIRYELPIHDREAMIRIHTQFRSYSHVAESLIGPSTRQSLILTAALMSSQDSYSGRKSEFPQLVEDQVKNGVFLTDSEETIVIDPQTKEEKKMHHVLIRKDEAKNPIRRGNPMADYKITITQTFLDKEPVYENGIEEQIKKSREATMRIATARAQAEAAVQDTTTAEAQGKAKVAEAQYEQEVLKSKQIVIAKQEKEVAEIEAAKRVAVAEQEKLEAETVAKRKLSVATLDKQSAEQTKQATVLLAEGESEARKLILAADGALKVKIEAYIKTQELWAQAFGQYRGSIVPSIVMGSGGSSGNQNATTGLDFIQLMGLKAAKDLALDLGVNAK